MSKKIILCTDGTWDTADKKSNVWKLWNAAIDDNTQIATYDEGVGTEGSIIEKLLGGATGLGLWQKVQDGYQIVASAYEPGDSIYLFGFSRGAFTARAIAGMIAKCGLPTRGDAVAAAKDAFDAYRSGDLTGLADYAMYDAKITMVGVWDTVGSLGIPALFGGVDPLVDGFLDTKLHPDVLNAYHAMAVDEHRTEFLLTLWTSQPAPGQVIRQVWFSGAHSDVGGADADQAGGRPALADITLAWMMRKAEALGVEFHPEATALYQRTFGPEYTGAALDESWNLEWGVKVWRDIADDAVLADSVALRCAGVADYRPENLDLTNGLPAGHYGKEIVAGASEEAQTAA